jgi:FeS assembly SUF system protein
MSEQDGSNLQTPNLEAPISVEAPTNLEAPIIEVLHTCFDPEIPVDIYELGLIYGIDVQPSGAVNIRMTLTSPGCPVAGSLPGEVEEKVRSVPGVTEAKVELVWDPPWCMEKMSEAAKLQLGMF